MEKKKVLIIDDDMDILETTGRLLSLKGFQVLSSETVEEGLRKLEEDKPDIILLDIMFPEKKTRGFEAITEIKSRNKEIPIIVFTAINREYAFEFTKEDIRADEFVNKPVDTELLVNLINKHTGEQGR